MIVVQKLPQVHDLDFELVDCLFFLSFSAITGGTMCVGCLDCVVFVLVVGLSFSFGTGWR